MTTQHNVCDIADKIDLEVNGKVAIITINRPQNETH
jgi:hypothetical protein